MTKWTFAALAAPVLLAGCQTWGPTWSEVTGRRYHLTHLNRTPTIIERVDEQGAFAEQRGTPIRIEPGRRVLQLQGVPPSPGWRGGGTLQEYVLDAKPCVRYYVNAQFESRLGLSQWQPVIDEVETIAGCKLASN